MCAMLLDAWEEHLAYPALRRKAQGEFKTLYGESDQRPDVALIEEKGSGISLCQDLRAAGVPVVPYNPGRYSGRTR
jgi:hypothetical protein